MAVYSEKFKGYIADVPELYLKRCDGRIFHFDELTQASTTINQQNTEINAGWSLFPVATLPGQSTMEISCSSAKFEPELFAFAAAESFSTVTTYNEYVNETIAAATADTIVLTSEPAEDDEYLKDSTGAVTTEKRSSVSIAGYTQIPSTGTLAAGQYQVAKSTKTITFFTSEVPLGTKVEVSYKTAVASIDEMTTDNQGTAICEVFAKYPVYSDGTDEMYSRFVA